MAELDTCSKCGAAVADPIRHRAWHSKVEDERTALGRAFRDLETSTKRTLQMLEAIVRSPH